MMSASPVAVAFDRDGRLATYDRTNIGAQSYTYNGMSDRVRVDKPTGTRRFVTDALSVFGGREVAGSGAERAQRGQHGASASAVKAQVRPDAARAPWIGRFRHTRTE
ncbi:MAG: hypothetical protein QNI87_11365 [Erythrobacter sp.]|uniref:hypothetical protein n=1 Tax=Erythrobacter sp. TaxID=1042 RepID=UPI00260E2A9D|nr:hypothetical protein [Erythrobacter sp.]MDJ0979116.1 hypothetical protein [Erythrobacter sp.]